MKVQTAYIFALARTLRELECDPAPLTRVDRSLEEGEFYRLCEEAVAISGDPTLALRFGASLHLGSHGVLGHALMSCRTLRQAAEFLVQHNPVKAARAGIRFAFDRDDAVLTMTPTIDFPGAPNFLTEAFFAAVVAGMEELTGAELHGCRIEFAFEPQMTEEIYRRYLRLPVAFGKAANRLVGPRDTLDLPLAASGNVVADIYLRQCSVLLRERDRTTNYAAEVRRILSSARGHVPNEYEVARALHVSGRTLRRRLRAEGASFQHIRDEVRNLLARAYLRETKLNVVEIGTVLGFEDAANFRRAFRRWNGCTPQKFRDSPRSDPTDALPAVESQSPAPAAAPPGIS